MSVTAPVPGERAGGVGLRAATLGDIPALVAIERASFSDPWDTRAFVSLLSAAASHVQVATEQERVVGYAALVLAADEAELANLAVADAARGRGVGRQLLSWAMARARDAGASAMYLEVRESNTVARALYGSAGFDEIGRRRRYYRDPDEDALVMCWRPGSDGRGAHADGPA